MGAVTINPPTISVVDKTIPPNILGLEGRLDCGWEIQKACDALIQEADMIINLQLKAYQDLANQKSELQSALDNTVMELHNANNPPWYKDPHYMGLTGILIGIFLTLSLRQ